MTTLPATIPSRRKTPISIPHTRSSSFDKVTTTLHSFQGINTKLIDAIAATNEQQKLIKNFDSLNIPSYKPDKTSSKFNTQRYGLWSTQKDFKMPNTVRAIPNKKTAQSRRPSFATRFANLKVQGSLPNLLSSTLTSGLTTSNLSPSNQSQPKISADQEKRIDNQININFRFKPAHHHAQAPRSARDRVNSAGNLDGPCQYLENSATFRESAGLTSGRFSRRSSIRKAPSPARLTARDDSSNPFVQSNIPSHQILPSVLGNQEFEDFTDEIQENLNQRKIGFASANGNGNGNGNENQKQRPSMMRTFSHSMSKKVENSLNNSGEGKSRIMNNNAKETTMISMNTTMRARSLKRAASNPKSRSGQSSGTGILGVKISEEQRERLARFIKDDFVNELIFSKYYKIMDEDQKMSTMKNLRAQVVENKDIRTQYRESQRESTRNFFSNKMNSSTVRNTEEHTKENILTTRGDDSPLGITTHRQAYEMFTPRESPLGLRSRAVTLGGSTINLTNISPKKEKNKDFDYYMNRELLKQAAKEDQRKRIKLVKKVVHVVNPFQEDEKKARFARIRKALKDKLFKCVELKLTPEELSADKKLFPSKAFEKQGSYAFIKAAKYGDQETVEQYLKDDRFYIFEYDQIKQTALHWAAKRGNILISQLLITSGADIDALDMGGRTPLYFALRADDPEMVRTLLLAKANPWSAKGLDYKTSTKDINALKYLSKARQLNIYAAFHNIKDRSKVWEREAKNFLKPLAFNDQSQLFFIHSAR